MEVLVTLSSKRKRKFNLLIPHLRIAILKGSLDLSRIWHEDMQQHFTIWADFQTQILSTCSDLSCPWSVLIFTRLFNCSAIFLLEFEVPDLKSNPTKTSSHPWRTWMPSVISLFSITDQNTCCVRCFFGGGKLWEAF